MNWVYIHEVSCSLDILLDTSKFNLGNRNEIALMTSELILANQNVNPSPNHCLLQDSSRTLPDRTVPAYHPIEQTCYTDPQQGMRTTLPVPQGNNCPNSIPFISFSVFRIKARFSCILSKPSIPEPPPRHPSISL